MYIYSTHRTHIFKTNNKYTKNSATTEQSCNIERDYVKEDLCHHGSSTSM